MSKVYIITGPPGAGKSSLVLQLARLSEKGVAIQADRIRGMVKGGYVLPWIKGEEQRRQRDLATKNICDISKNSKSLGFDIFIDDVVLNKELIETYKKSLGEDLKLFLLLPSEDILIKRLKERKEDQIMFDRTKELRIKFANIRDEIDWNVIDNSNLTIDQTIKLIFES